jgi:hypothetical protein
MPLRPIQSERSAVVGMTKLARSTCLMAGLLASTLGLATCGGSAGGGSAGGLRHFDDQTVSFDYPGAWADAKFDVVSSFSSVLVYLSTAHLSDPCDRTANSIACVRSAASGLGPDGVLVEWSRNGFPGWTFDPTKGQPMNVGGRRATLEQVVPSQDDCGAIGGARELVVTIDDPTPDMNWTAVRACLRGPSLDGLQAQIEAMLATVAWKQ